MTDGRIRLSVTLTSEAVSATYHGAGGEELGQADGGAPDLRARPTIDVLRQWLDRWGLFSSLSSRSTELAAELGLDADFTNLPVPETFRVLGEHLYRLAFPDGIDSLFFQARAAASAAGTSLRVVLSIKDEERDRGWLADLPWEFLYRPDPNGYFLAAESSFVLSRYLDYSAARAEIEPHALPLKVLSVVAIPEGDDTLGKAAWKLSAQLRDDAKQIVAKPIDWADLAQSEERSQAPDVVHIIGVARAAPGGRMEITLPGATGQGEEALLTLTRPPDGQLAGWRPPSFVVLHLLEANPFDYAATFGGHARALVRKGVPAVLAMQYPMPPGQMVEFAKTLYQNLADAVSIEEAVQRAREGFLQRPGPGDRLFGAPVLYLQAPDGRLVEPEAPQVPAGEPRKVTGPSGVEHGPAVAPVAGRDAGAARPAAEALRVLEAGPTEADLLRLIGATPWSSLTLAEAGELELRIRERLRTESGVNGPLYEAMLKRLARGGGPGGQ